MARRVIATAEVQVAANVGQAEAGLEGLTESFRQIGAVAARAAEKTEAAFMSATGNIQGGYQVMLRESNKMLASMEQTDARAASMAATFREALAAIRALSAVDGYEEKAIQALGVYRQIAGTLQAIEGGLFDVDKRAEAVADSAQMIEGELRAAGYRAEQLERAFRDVGQAIDLAMAGGLEQVQDDIRDTIRRLNDLGGEFKEVGAIGERALNGIGGEADENLEQAARAAMRLAQQLRDVEQVELNRLESEARQAAAALDATADAARRADRSIDGMSNVASRARSSVSGLAGVLGTAGLGYAAFSAAKAGIEMTQQLEKSEAMFLGLTGSVEGAADMLERMVTFARETPYNLAGVSEAAAQLLAIGDDFGVTTSNIEDYLTTFGDAITATGGGEEQFIRIVRVLGQMSATGKVLGQDMNQLAQNLPGYAVWEALAEGANTSEAELRRLQDLGQLDNLLTGDKAVRILIDGMKELPGAAGAMERRMNTLGGAIEKFRETAQFALTRGLIPFSETAQDTLSDPVILNSVEDLTEAFGDMLSSGLEEVAPELDDLAVAAENFMNALDNLAPAFGDVVDAVGDFLNFVSPIVGGIGDILSAIIGLDDGLGKIALAIPLAFAGPWGIAAAAVLGVSGAMDFFDGGAEQAANSARLLAAAQEEVNVAMAAGEPEIYSAAQQAAIAASEDLRDNYAALHGAMVTYGISIAELNSGFSAMAGGIGEVTPEMQALIATFEGADENGRFSMLEGEFLMLQEAFANGTDAMSVEAEKLTDVLVTADIEAIASGERRVKTGASQTEAIMKFRQQERDDLLGHAKEFQTITERWGELDEERTETLTGLLQEQADAYMEWEDGINGSTEGAALSLSDVADEAENSARRMIDAINENSIATANWKNNIVTAAVDVQGALGLTDEQAQDFMGTLGELGPAAAPALQSMIDDFNTGGTELQDFFNATSLNAAVMDADLTTAFDNATGAAPGLAEGLAEGTLTVEEVLAQIPAAMTAAGIDLETAAGMIDIADEMGTVGGQGVDGLVLALTSAAALARARSAGSALANASIRGVEAAYDTGSPSRVTYAIGEFVVEGLINGIQSMTDEAVAQSVQTASLMSGGIAGHFARAEDPQEEARKFAEDVAKSIIDELIAEQEAVADAAEALAEAAADRLSEAWDRVKDRFKTRDIKEAITEAEASLAEAKSELASAQSLAGAKGAAARSAAKSRVNEAEAALAKAEAADVRADRLADKTLTTFQRGTEDAVAALGDRQKSETEAIQARIDAANRNLDPVARAAAEADLAATKERHETEMTALDRRREDEEKALQRRLDNENDIREAAIKAKEDELNAFQDAFDDIVDSIKEAIENLPGLRADVRDAQRDVQGAFFDQFESLLENVGSVDRSLLKSIGAKAGLTPTEVNNLIKSALASEAADKGAAAANLGVDQLLDLLSSGLFTLGANGALGIAAGLSSGAQAIAEALFDSIQYAINAALYDLQIQSPSRVTGRLIGEPMAEGIARGITSAQGAVLSAMTGLLDNVMSGTRIPSASQLVGDSEVSGSAGTGMYRGPLVTMPGAIIQDATDADLVAQRVLVAMSATGVDV